MKYTENETCTEEKRIKARAREKKRIGGLKARYIFILL
jgi:hypothetical protein